ncbi:Trichome birefringence-like family [Parasponia andersonii]|uniref:Trichome birefringence-like family n=1 Tax=Parasponia andersonii TaxID=3476 RepID=A0A2P5DSP3_PARAD|nr:Trichome birefringence-like family [Parasponia andersonii]
MDIYEISKPSNSIEQCNVFEGKWIPDEIYPWYNASQCPFAGSGFNCMANGRGDRGYTKWRWKPRNCEIPRFSAREILEKLRGKRVVFAGDSLSRTQWESLICMLMIGVDDKRSVYEVNGKKITKQKTFGCTPGSVPRRSPKRVKSTLRLDQLDDISREWIDSDDLIFNSGHWWTPTKLFEM